MGDNIFDLSDRIALITGSGSGIGLALARGLGRAGATVVLNGRNAAKLVAAAESLRGDGLDVHTAPFDVAEPDAVAAAVETIERDVGPISIAINNAGVQQRVALEDFPYEGWREMLRIHLDGAFLVGQAVARRMIPRKAGKIINICSVTSELARPSITPYTTAKGGMKMLTKGMCAEWGRYGIQANGIAPGYFLTELNRALTEDPTFNAWVEARTPAGRWGDLDELVGAAVFLSSSASSYVNGHIIAVDGGMTATV